MKLFHRGLGNFLTQFIVSLGIVLIVLIVLPYILFSCYGPSPEEDCQSNLHQTAFAMSMYSQDYGNKLPPAIFHDAPFGWANVLQPYMESYPIFQCRVDTHALQKAPKPDEPGFTDYWMNSNFSGIGTDHIKRPEQIILLGDGDGGSRESIASYAINYIPKSWLQVLGSPAVRHYGGANYAFADAHVKWLKPEQVSQLPTSKKHPVYTFSIK